MAECDSRIKSHLAQITACARQGVDRIAPTNTESADITAGAIITIYELELDAFVTAIYPYCVGERMRVQELVGDFGRPFIQPSMGDDCPKQLQNSVAFLVHENGAHLRNLTSPYKGLTPVAR